MGGSLRLRISGRSSDLARIQVMQVAATLRAADPSLEIVTQLRESLGDRMLEDPLWAMPEKGVFTEDFVEDLRSGRTDLVVHSWKDLPTEPRVGTGVVATLPREDVRDVLLMRRDLWATVTPGTRITVLSSSPRRAHNLEPFLSWALPVRNLKIDFIPVRGNVPTRLRKLIDGEHHGLVVAKAALDRLLTSTSSEFESMRTAVRSAIDRCRFMVLPVSENPTGAAQGALAMEIATGCSPEITFLIQSLNHQASFDEATREREVLRSYGGGCHQKIGVTVLSRPYGTVVSVRGLTDAGERLERFELEAERKTPRARPDRIWPPEAHDAGGTIREPLVATTQRPAVNDGLWIARADALPVEWPVEERPVWTAGLQTWKRVAERGVWVTGSAEGLGEREDPRIDTLAGRTVPWLKLTHDRAVPLPGQRQLATYRVRSKSFPSDPSQYTHFFWTSGSEFADAVERHPGIRGAWHGCGPGNSWTTIRERLGPGGHLEVWLSREDWVRDVTGESQPTPHPPSAPSPLEGEKALDGGSPPSFASA